MEKQQKELNQKFLDLLKRQQKQYKILTNKFKEIRDLQVLIDDLTTQQLTILEKLL